MSATLLDGPPIAEPVPRSSFISARFLVSLLPKPNPTVGGKKEKVPAAPAHTVPTVVFGSQFVRSGRYSLVPTAWVGFLPLPQSVGKMLGVNASMKQLLAGMSFENLFQLSKMTLITSVGGQWSTVNVSGGITKVDAQDTFDASLTSFYLSQGVQGRQVPLWANTMVLFRLGRSKFKITEEQTEFDRVDRMTDVPLPLSVQISVGMSMLKKSLHLAVSEYMVPNRLIMPRVSLAYQYSLGTKASDKSFDPRSQDDSNRPKKNRKRKKRVTDGHDEFVDELGWNL